MEDAAQPVLQDPNAEVCPRCLQSVPPKVSRCPNCLQPIYSLRLLPLAIGAVGLLALVFVMFVMLRMARNEEAATAPLPPDDATAQQQQLFPDASTANSKARQSKPEKRPPLNER